MADREVISVRCNAINKNGTRCRRHTKRGDKCWNHLVKDEGLRIKKSTIPGVGLGLFAAKDFKKDTKVVDYKGEVMDHPSGGDYVLEINPHRFIDARKSIYAGGFANTLRKGDKGTLNSKLTSYRSEGRIKSTKPIKAGKEVLVAYGRNYWKRGVKAKG